MERLDKHFKVITRAVFERHGFARAEIINQWTAIAGDKLARWATPVRVTWPRPGPAREKMGGTLMVRIDPALTLDLQYEAPRIIERINGYFGYSAIGAIRAVQGEAATSARPAVRSAPQNAEEQQEELPELSGIADKSLQSALHRLGSQVRSQERRPRRG
jgi:hypothetical protein